MPVYEYECTNEECEGSQGFEEKRSMSDPLRQRCPACRCKVVRVYSPVGIAFRGEGWYVTDYKGKTNTPKGEKRVSVKGSGVSKSAGQSPRWAQD